MSYGLGRCETVRSFAAGEGERLTPRPDVHGRTRPEEGPLRAMRPRIGDVFEIETSRGLAYLQYTHRHDQFGELVRVLPETYASRPPRLEDVMARKERFYIFFPVGGAARQGLVARVGNYPIPEWARNFPLMRWAGLESRSGEVKDWWLFDGQKEWWVGPLRPEHHDLSLVEIWNPAALTQAIADGWSPRDELGQAGPDAGSEEPEPTPDASGEPSRTMRHFLYFPTKRTARAAAQQLEANGYRTEVHRREDSWLALALGEVPASEDDIEETRKTFEAVADSLGGEYDGWEMET